MSRVTLINEINKFAWPWGCIALRSRYWFMIRSRLPADLIISRKARSILMLAAALATVAPFVRADVQLLFDQRQQYILISKSGILPERFTFKICKNNRYFCGSLGKRAGYTLEDIRMHYLALSERRVDPGLTPREAQQLEDLGELIEAIEQPVIHRDPHISLKYIVKGDMERFVRNVEAQLASK